MTNYDRVGNNNSYWNVANKKTKMKTKEKVKALLIKSPHLKDNDDKLLATYWYYELKDMKRNPETINGMNLLTLISEGRLTNAKTVIRMRRKLQEEFEELRGKKYKHRKETLQKKVRKELGYDEKN